MPCTIERLPAQDDGAHPEAGDETRHREPGRLPPPRNDAHAEEDGREANDRVESRYEGRTRRTRDDGERRNQTDHTHGQADASRDAATPNAGSRIYREG